MSRPGLLILLVVVQSSVRPSGPFPPNERCNCGITSITAFQLLFQLKFHLDFTDLLHELRDNADTHVHNYLDTDGLWDLALILCCLGRCWKVFLVRLGSLVSRKREPCYHGRCMWSAGMFSCLICVSTIHARTKSSPAECRLVFISALTPEHQVRRRNTTGTSVTMY